MATPNPDDLKKKALETASVVEDALRSITDNIQTAFETAMMGADRISQSTAKDIQARFNKMSKVTDDISANAVKLRKGLLDVKNVKNQIQNIDIKQTALATQLVTHLSQERGALVDINGLKNEALDLSSNLTDEQRTLIKEYIKLEGYNNIYTDQLQEQVSEQEKITNKLGISAKLIKGVSKIPIIGDLVDTNEALEAMNENIAKGGNRLTALGAGIGSLGKSLLASLTDPLVVIGLIIKAFKVLIELGFRADTQITDLSKSMAISKEEATALRDRFVEIQNTGNSLFETTKNLVAAQLELASAFGATRGFSEQQVKDQVYLTKQIGLSVEEAASLQQIAMANGLTADQVVKSTIKQTSSLAKQTGIQLDNKKILGEVAKISGQLRLQYQNNPGLIAQAVVQTQKLGISLEQAKKMASGLLDFESSIANELEAELITGKDLNLEKARLLALNGDSAGAAAEMLKQVGGTAEFTRMNIIQQEALARAMGMSADELANSLVQQENLNRLGAQTQAQVKAKVEELKAAGKVEEANQLMASIGNEEQAQSALERISAQDKFNAAMDKLKNMVASLVEGPMQKILDKIVNFISSTERLKAAFSALKMVAAGIAAVIAGMAVAWAVMNPIGAIAGLAAAALVGGVVYSQIKDGEIDTTGKKPILSGDFGSVQLNPKDKAMYGADGTIKVGTNLMGNNNSGGNSGGGTDISPLVVEMQNVKAVLSQILAKEGSVYLDSTKVGTALTVATYKTQ
jgi:hypothetical protein